MSTRTLVGQADALMAEINKLAGGPEEGWIDGKAQLGYLHLRGEENSGFPLYKIYCHINEQGGCVTLSGSLRIEGMINLLRLTKESPEAIDRLRYHPKI
jgi:hypothetical protein